MTETKRNDTTAEHPLNDTHQELADEQLPKYEDVQKPSPLPVQDQPKPETPVISQPLQFGLNSLNCTCPHCHQQIVTRVEKTNGLMAWLICAILILIGCWFGCCLIPFFIDNLKNVAHYCPRCGVLLGEKKLI